MSSLRISDMRAIAIMVMMAVLLNTTAPVFAAVGSSDGQTPVFDNKVLICTAFGFKYISNDEAPEQQHEPQIWHCPLCILKQSQGEHVDFTPQEQLFSYPASVKHENLVGLEKLVFFFLWHESPHAPRAPPRIS